MPLSGEAMTFSFVMGYILRVLKNRNAVHIASINKLVVRHDCKPYRSVVIATGSQVWWLRLDRGKQFSNYTI